MKTITLKWSTEINWDDGTSEKIASGLESWEKAVDAAKYFFALEETGVLPFRVFQEPVIEEVSASE